MVWSSSCSTVAPIAHAVIIARWGVSWWTVSPGMLAALSSSATQGGRMRIRRSQRQTRPGRSDDDRAAPVDAALASAGVHRAFGKPRTAVHHDRFAGDVARLV